ncbi:MAG TPA: methylmalonyl-CoA carboxyltransferase, partial [Desulfobacterales bacterium]|nr:methylmalonyl-CoA carboxyltransferase [Desulfobacterales bacterium]
MTEKTHPEELERLKDLQQRAFMGGGEKARERQRSKGKLTPRERLDLLFDKDSFVEL